MNPMLDARSTFNTVVDKEGISRGVDDQASDKAKRGMSLRQPCLRNVSTGKRSRDSSDFVVRHAYDIRLSLDDVFCTRQTY